MSCSSRVQTSATIVVAAVLFISVVGCDSQPELLPATGTVTYNGEPLRFGIVMFQPPTGQISQATIQPDGTFKLATFKPDDGGPAGLYRVSVLCYEAHDPKGPGLQENEGGGIMLGKSLIPLKYTRASSSGLTAEVKAGEGNEFHLKLEGTAPR